MISVVKFKNKLSLRFCVDGKRRRISLDRNQAAALAHDLCRKGAKLPITMNAGDICYAFPDEFVVV